ncbi:MAG: (d)CMP kinase [Fastidiosipilaceae bacterium]|jgi:cytidylate kinase
MKQIIAIAIDGPGGAGKSTVARRVADRLNILYLDTGAMYRACGLKASRLGLKKEDVPGIEEMLGQTKVDVRFVDDEQHVFLDDEDVTELIRTPEISVWASDISAVSACRLMLVKAQRDIASNRSVVMDGRDIGSYVLPDANVKIFLTASVKERAARRYAELRERGEEASYESVLADLNYRDHQDTNRSFAPLVCAKDAVCLDTTEMDVEETVNAVLDLVSKFIEGTGRHG